MLVSLAVLLPSSHHFSINSPVLYIPTIRTSVCKFFSFLFFLTFYTFVFFQIFSTKLSKIGDNGHPCLINQILKGKHWRVWNQAWFLLYSFWAHLVSNDVPFSSRFALSFFKLSWNLYNKISHLKVCNSVPFSTFMMLYNYHFWFQNVFITFKENSVPIKQSFPIPYPKLFATNNLLCLYGFTYFG